MLPRYDAGLSYIGEGAIQCELLLFLPFFRLLIFFIVSSYLPIYETGNNGRLPPCKPVVEFVAQEVVVALRKKRQEMERYCDGLVLTRRPPLVVIDDIVAEDEEKGVATPAWVERAYDLMMERLMLRLHGL